MDFVMCFADFYYSRKVYEYSIACVGLLVLSMPDVMWSQPAGTPPKTLAVVVAHADDEAPVAPVLARYAREGVKVYLIIASNGVAGVGQQGFIPRPEVTVQGDDLIRQRAEEARCATQAISIQPPILLGFPDGKLGDYVGDRTTHLPVDAAHCRGTRTPSP